MDSRGREQVRGTGQAWCLTFDLRLPLNYSLFDCSQACFPGQRPLQGSLAQKRMGSISAFGVEFYVFADEDGGRRMTDCHNIACVR